MAQKGSQLSGREGSVWEQRLGLELFSLVSFVDVMANSSQADRRSELTMLNAIVSLYSMAAISSWESDIHVESHSSTGQVLLGYMVFKENINAAEAELSAPTEHVSLSFLKEINQRQKMLEGALALMLYMKAGAG
ncbi:hypothetical protein SRHO_G00051040 [Serrasalmus rhombeus]